MPSLSRMQNKTRDPGSDGAASPAWGEIVLAGALWAAFTVIVFQLRESFFVHETWLFGEPSWPLWVGDHLLKGGMIYRDAAYSYGVLSVWYLAAAAKIFGSTAHTVALFGVLPGAVGAASGMHFLRRSGVGTRMRWALWCLLVAPALWHACTNTLAYQNIELALVVTIFSFLSPVDERTRLAGFAAGVLLGLLNLTKFGSFLCAGLAIIAWDAIRAFSLRRDGSGIVSHFIDQVVKAELPVLFGFLAVELPRVIVSWFVFPPEIWREYAMFPLDLLGSYDTFGDPWAVVPWVREATWGYRIGTIGSRTLLMLLVACGAVVALVRTARARGRPPAADGMVLLAALSFFVGFLFYYHHPDHVMVYSAPLIVPAVAMLARFKPLPRLFIAGILFACTGGAVGGKLLLQKDGRVRVAMPNGETLWMKPKDKAVFEQVSAGVGAVLKDPAAGSTGTVVVWRAISAGWHHYMGWPEASRHGYLIAPEWVRPYERDKVMNAFLNSSVHLVKLPADGDALAVTDDPATWRTEEWLRVPPAMRQTFIDHLAPPVKVETAANCWLAFKPKPVKP